MYNISSLKLLKLLGNTVVMGTVSAPGTISLDHNDTKLAVVGPLAHTITIMDPDNMNEVMYCTLIIMYLHPINHLCRTVTHPHR